MSKPVIIGVDLGATNIEAAAVQGEDILASKKKKTRAKEGVDVVIERIAKTVRKVMDKMDAGSDDYDAFCIGAPGAIDTDNGIVNSAPNLGWTHVPLGERLEEELGLPVIVDNDVNIGVLGEHVYGAGKGSSTWSASSSGAASAADWCWTARRTMAGAASQARSATWW